MSKQVMHYCWPHYAKLQGDRYVHRLTLCAVENRGAYDGTANRKSVTCKQCLEAMGRKAYTPRCKLGQHNWSAAGPYARCIACGVEDWD